MPNAGYSCRQGKCHGLAGNAYQLFYFRLRRTLAGAASAKAAIGRWMCSRINRVVVRRISCRQYDASWMSSKCSLNLDSSDSLVTNVSPLSCTSSMRLLITICNSEIQYFIHTQ